MLHGVHRLVLLLVSDFASLMHLPQFLHFDEESAFFEVAAELFFSSYPILGFLLLQVERDRSRRHDSLAGGRELRGSLFVVLSVAACEG